jgi:hypothetical protein
VVLKHDLHGSQDCGRFGFKLTQPAGNLPQSCDPSTAQAQDGYYGGCDGKWVHGWGWVALVSV